MITGPESYVLENDHGSWSGRRSLVLHKPSDVLNNHVTSDHISHGLKGREKEAAPPMAPRCSIQGWFRFRVCGELISRAKVAFSLCDVPYVADFKGMVLLNEATGRRRQDLADQSVLRVV